MHKTLIIKELKNAIALRIEIKTARGIARKEIARFCKAGMGWVALGAASYALINGAGFLDEIKFEGSKDTYDMLVSLEVIDPKVAVNA
jgi:hypothetical protein